jgi:prepilin-type N-terminal cleavage/methylation domain-containing protein
VRSRDGFTIIELMVVVTVIAVVAAIAFPNLVSARVTANETSALATLRTLTSAQAQAQASAHVDMDGDGTGEHGFFRELSGAVGVRTSGDGSTVGNAILPPVLSTAFRRVTTAGAVGRSGYRFRIVLPAADGTGVFETPTGAFTGTVDPDMAEVTWCVTAWPVNSGLTGNRAFFANQTGDILATEATDYTGENPMFLGGAAFQLPGPVNSLTGTLAIGTVGRDGNVWKPAN